MSIRMSKHLEQELSRRDIKRLPYKLQKELTETMKRPDFDPDKLAAALEKARSQQAGSFTEEATLERCTWDEAANRSMMLLGGALFLCCFFLLELCGVILIMDQIWGWSIKTWVCDAVQSHPLIAISVGVLIYLLWLVWLVIRVCRHMEDSM